MFLFTAGPAQLSAKLIPSLSSPTLHHRSKEFRKIFNFCHDELLRICPMQEVFFLSSSGTGAMESAVSSFSPKHLLILENGKFSARWGEIAKSFKIATTILSCPWDRSHTPKEIQKILEKHNEIDGVCMCAVESSGGVREEYENICKAIKMHNSSILTFVDGIALWGAEKWDTQNIDILVSSSQKVLGLPAGLGFVFVSSYALKLLEHQSPLSYYLALQNYLQDPIAFSLSSHMFLALEFVLKHINFEHNYTLIQERFKHTKEILLTKNATLYAKTPSSSIIAFNDPNSHIKTALSAKGIIISDGQNHLKESISRIGNFGGFQEYEILLEALRQI